MAKKKRKPPAPLAPPPDATGDDAPPPSSAPPTEPQDADQAMERMTAAFADLLHGHDDESEPADPFAADEADSVRRAGGVDRAGGAAERSAGREGARGGAGRGSTGRPAPPPSDAGEEAPSHFWENEAGPLPPAGEVSVAGVVEAMLFVGHAKNEPLQAATVAELVRGVQKEDLPAVIAELNAGYERRKKPYVVLEERGGWRLALRDEYGAVRNRFYGRLKTVRLTQGAIETLSVVAYLQPVAADEVNRLRGGNSGSILNQLVRRELLAVERSPEAPRKVRYRTTARFLKLFHLDSIHDLPKSQDVDER